MTGGLINLYPVKLRLRFCDDKISKIAFNSFSKFNFWYNNVILLDQLFKFEDIKLFFKNTVNFDFG